MFHINRMIMFGFVFFLAQGCYNDLEEDISGILLIENLQNESDMTAALVAIYDVYGDMYWDGHSMQITGYGSDDITTWWGGNKAPLRVFDGFNYGNGENADIQWLNFPWDWNWKVVYYCNALIEGLKTSTASEELITAIDAEARFLRADAYFNLVKRYGNLPIISDETEPTGEEVRATVLENYQFIESDLLIAEANMPGPGEVAQIGRASSATAKAVLSNLYLTWAGWPVKDQSKYAMAASKAKELIDMNYFELLPIDELWLEENQNSRESLFAIQFSREELFTNRWARSNSFHEALGFSDLYPERQFFMDFPDGPRKDITFATEIPQKSFSGGVIVTKDPATKPWEESQRNHPMYGKFTIAVDDTNVTNGRTGSYRAQEIYRYAEVLLIYAEAWARANGGVASGEALEAYNQVRRRAEGFPYDQPEVTVDVASVTADEIVAEKGWELAGEGKRWYDLVRLEMVNDVISNRDPDEEVPLTRTSVTSNQYIAPIPFQAISTSNLVQNPEGFRIQ